MAIRDSVTGLPHHLLLESQLYTMAHQLRMIVAAEGVETEAQAAFPTGIGCDELQGYHLGRPVVAWEAERCF